MKSTHSGHMYSGEILKVKENFNRFFQEELYGTYKKDSNIILSRGSWNDNLIHFPDFFDFCLRYSLKKHWFGYSNSLGHDNVLNSLVRLVNIGKKNYLYSEGNLALTLGNTFTIGIVFKQLKETFGDVAILTLAPYYPSIIKSIHSYFNRIYFVSGLETENEIISNLQINIKEKDIKILFLSNFIGVEGRTFSIMYWQKILDFIIEKNIFLVIDEGASFNLTKYPDRINHEGVVRIISYSKKYGIPGMKLGYMLAGEQFIKKFYDSASTGYGGPLSSFFLLSEFLFDFEYIYYTKKQNIKLLDNLARYYNIRLIKMKSLYKNFCKTLETNKRNYFKNLMYLKKWLVLNKGIFEKIYVYNGINVLVKPKKYKGKCHSFFIHAVAKHGISIMPSSCLGDTDDSYIRISILEPTLLFKKGLARLKEAFGSFNPEENRNYKAIFLDFDGTLTRERDNSHLENIAHFMSDVKRKGVLITLATGKGLYFVKDLLVEKKDLLDTYYILYDGALIINIARNEILFSSPLHANLVASLTKKIAAITSNFYLNQEDGLYSPKNSLSVESSMYRFWKEGKGVGNTYQIYIRDLKDDKLNEIRKILGSFDVHSYEFRSRRGETSILVHNRNVNKKTAILKVLSIKKLVEEEAIIAGDGINDLDSFTLRSYKIAPSAAIPDIKKLADLILEDEQSLSETINRLL